MTCEPWKVGRRTLLNKLSAAGTGYDQVVMKVDTMEDRCIARKGGKKQDLTQWLVAEQIPISDKSKLREYCCTVGSNTQDIHIAGAAGQGGQQHHQGHVLVAEGAGDSALTRNSDQITNISISVQEQQHAEVQPDGGAGHRHILVAEDAEDSIHATYITVSVQVHSQGAGQGGENEFSIGERQLNNRLQLEMGSKPCLERLQELKGNTVGFLMEGSRCDSQTWDSWEMRQCQGARKEELRVSQI